MINVPKLGVWDPPVCGIGRPEGVRNNRPGMGFETTRGGTPGQAPRVRGEQDAAATGNLFIECQEHAYLDVRPLRSLWL